MPSSESNQLCVQVLKRCLAVLLELPTSARHKQRTRAAVEGLHHMVGCLTYYVSLGLSALNEKQLAAHVGEVGKLMLAGDMWRTESGVTITGAAPAAAGAAGGGGAPAPGPLMQSDTQLEKDRSQASAMRFQRMLQGDDSRLESAADNKSMTFGDILKRRGVLMCLMCLEKLPTYKVILHFNICHIVLFL